MVRSIISNKVEVRDSPIHGKGMFAQKDIKKGEVVFIKGGYILTRDEFYSNGTINSYLPLDDNYFLAAKSKEDELQIKLYNNHSCDPNCGLRGEITFIAIKDIRQGEELTCDYAFIDNEDYEFECSCGSVNCRHIVTGRDWKIKELQEKYRDYFAAYLKEKFN
ncbi:SET domain-containing protein-lysine N-methyltransferase [Lachnospiraceae bacterium 66-29]